MWYLHSTEKWLEEVVKRINDKQFLPDNSKFMIAFFSSMDRDFVSYFQNSKEQISSYSGRNFHIFTPLIFENQIIPDDDWRNIRRQFKSYGIPVSTDPTFVFFKLVHTDNGTYEPNFFAGYWCRNFNDFPNKLRNAIDISIDISDISSLQKKLTEIFLSRNIIPTDNVDRDLKQTFSNSLPKSKIFISHSSIDKSFAKRLINELSQDSNVKFWIDENEILVGDDIQKNITKSLKQSDYLFLIISENSIKSDWVKFELSQFIGFANGENIIPIVISKGQNFSEPLDNQVRRLKYLDFSDNTNWNRNIYELKKLLYK